MTLLRYISTHLTFQVSQGSVATNLRWGENFNKLLFDNSFLNIVVKKLWKSVNICQSYRKSKRGTFFMAHGVYTVFRKKVAHLNLVTTSANVDWCSKFFHWRIHNEPPYVPIIEISISTGLCCYTTLLNLKIKNNRVTTELILIPEKKLMF